MNKFEAINVVIEGKGTTESGDYEITAVGSNGVVRKFTAGALNLNEFAFATSSMEIGEYNQTITITQKGGSQYLNLDVRKE
jgi:hypothetical protein